MAISKFDLLVREHADRFTAADQEFLHNLAEMETETNCRNNQPRYYLNVVDEIYTNKMLSELRDQIDQLIQIESSNMLLQSRLSDLKNELYHQRALQNSNHNNLQVAETSTTSQAIRNKSEFRRGCFPMMCNPVLTLQAWSSRIGTWIQNFSICGLRKKPVGAAVYMPVAIPRTSTVKID